MRETEAEAIAFVVSQAIGLDTGPAASDYIRLYNGDTETLTASLDRIQRAACLIIEAIETAQRPHEVRSIPASLGLVCRNKAR